MSSPFVHSHPATHGGTPCSTPSPFPPPLPQAAYPPYADEDDLAPTPASLAISHLPLSDLAACYVDGGVGLQAAVVFDHFRRLDGNNSGCDAGGCGGHSHGHGHAPSPADAVAATFAGSFTMPPVDPDALAAEARAHEAVRRRFPPAIAQELIQSVRAGEYSRLHMMGMSAPDAAAAANATAASSSTPRLSAHSTNSPGAPESDAGLSRGHSFSGMSTRAPSPQSGGFYSPPSGYSSYSSYPGRVDEDESVDTLSPLRREGGSLPRADYGHQSNQNNHIPAHYYNQEQQLAKQQQLSRPVLVFPSLASALRFRDTASQAANEAAHLLDVLDHFAAYARMATAQLRREAHKVDQVEWKYKALLGGMSEKFEHRLECVKKNQEFLNEIIKNQTMADTRMDYAAIRRLLPPDRRLPNFDKVQAALKQCVRDWSVAGASEREEAYMPILKYLRDNFANPGDHKVLIPGTGLSRLHFEIARLGFQSHAIEFSYYMLLPAFYMLNCVDRPAQWQVYPWVLSTCNLRSSATRTKPVYIPDIACSNVPLSPVAFDGLSMLAGDFLEVVDGISNAYDSVVTCFFIDTAHNVLEYIRCISRILKPGGKWVNFGPLLYHYADMDGQPSLELAWDEIKSTLISFGLALDHESHGHKAHYCSPPESFASSGYNCVFSVCTKIEDTSQSSGWAPDVLAALDGAVTVGAAAAKVASGEGPTTAAVEAAKVEAAAILAAMASADAAAAKAAAAVEAAETEAEAKAAAGSNGRGRGSGRGRGNGARNAHNAGPRGGKKAQ